jgi:hypothetical protein
MGRYVYIALADKFIARLSMHVTAMLIRMTIITAKYLII